MLIELFLSGTLWFEYGKPQKDILTDVTSKCSAEEKQRAYEPDQVTYCHEATHQLNAQIRNKTPGRDNAFYTGGGKCAILLEPNVRLSQVAPFVKQYRNSTYELYLVQQASGWDDSPLYILDEWTAYCNGSQAAAELGVPEHGSNERALWFCHYADALVQAVEQYDPNYSQMKELKEFVEWQKQRTQELTKKTEKSLN